MKTYLADTNIFLRFWIKDNIEQYKKSEAYFKLAQNEKIQILVINEVIFEMEYILRKLYKYDKKVISEWISKLVLAEYFDIEDRHLWLKLLSVYEKNTIDLVDIFLFEKAKDMGVEVLTFDKDLEILKKVYKEMNVV